jgi:hypothetical protein
VALGKNLSCKVLDLEQNSEVSGKPLIHEEHESYEGKGAHHRNGGWLRNPICVAFVPFVDQND